MKTMIMPHPAAPGLRPSAPTCTSNRLPFFHRLSFRLRRNASRPAPASPAQAASHLIGVCQGQTSAFVRRSPLSSAGSLARGALALAFYGVSAFSVLLPAARTRRTCRSTTFATIIQSPAAHMAKSQDAVGYDTCPSFLARRPKRQGFISWFGLWKDKNNTN